MPRGRKLTPLVLTDEQPEQLEAWSRSTSMPRGLVLRARLILASAEGLTNTAVAGQLGISLPTVGKWRKRFLELGVQGLRDDARPGAPRTYDDEKVAAVIHRALHEGPKGSRIWSVRQMADEEGISKGTVQRRFSLFGVNPHLSKTFKLANDPFFIEKVRDITGLYLNPPDHAVAICVDEKTQIHSSAGPCAAGPAIGFRLCRRVHARLHPARDDNSVRGPGRCQRQSDREVPQAAPPSGMALLPTADREGDTRRA